MQGRQYVNGVLVQVSPSAILGSDLGLDLGPDELAELLSEARLPRDDGECQRGMQSAVRAWQPV